MKREIKIEDTIVAGSPRNPNGFRRRLRKRLLNPLLCSICASFGIFGGISSLFVGVMCAVIHSIVPGDLMFDRMGTILLIAGIPMILIGSIFLDEIDGNS